ncbi:MAG: hypothetical protein KF916_05530 [Microbacteriaceae bacterium]|nr:hypothetical protein [Microbacteriaceae bacterium]
MKLKLPPQTPVYWTDTKTLKIGFEDPLELIDVTPSELKLVDLLRKGSSPLEAASHAKAWGISDSRSEQIIAKAKPQGKTLPRVAVYGSGVLATAMSEAMSNVFPTTDNPEVVVLVGNWAIPSNAWRKFSEAQLAHLAIIQQENEVLVGPIVRPEQTPCIRCHFLNQADKHPDLLKLVMQRAISNTKLKFELLTMHRLAAQLAVALLVQDAEYGWKIHSDLNFEKFSTPFHEECGCR